MSGSVAVAVPVSAGGTARVRRRLGGWYGRWRDRIVPAPVGVRIKYVAAYIWRRLMVRTTFVAVTGSLGKTTAKECLAAIVGSRHRVVATSFNRNDPKHGVPGTLLRVRPWHRFAVVEIGTVGPGTIENSARLVRPDIAVVLSVAGTHTTVFDDLEATAAEKAELVKALRPGGIAVLNADDPRVMAMSVVAGGPVKTFGRSPAAELRADAVSSAWPGRLAFAAHHGSETVRVQTDLLGAHWVTSALAALLTGMICGVPLREGAAAITRVRPFPARMQPVRLPSGATLIRDEFNSGPTVCDAAFEVFASASVPRRVLILGDLSDTGERPHKRMRALGRRAAQLADLAIFVGTEHAHHGVRGALEGGLGADRVRSFLNLREASDFLSSELRQGDLVLMKGRTTAHLSRLVFAQFGDIACWRSNCRLTCACDFCGELGAAVRFRAPGDGGR